jgi:hypothetical protein
MIGWEGCKRKLSAFILRYCPSILPEGIEENSENLRIAGLRLTNRAVDLANRKRNPDYLTATASRELQRSTTKRNSEISKKCGS